MDTSRSSQPHSGAELFKLTPKQIRDLLGPPQRTTDPFKGQFGLMYDGMSLYFEARDREMRDDASMISVSFYGDELSETAVTFAWMIPKGIELGCTIEESEKLLGSVYGMSKASADVVEWHQYSRVGNESRNCDLRFDHGRLKVINIGGG